ncbi:MAG TPA: RibD family protein [Hyphomicrobiaceae bacterium]|nr:RibD family protein [Hyphomicrobiaceae bacterium]
MDYEHCFSPLREAGAGRSFVVAQLGQSLDGRIATPTGESRWINGHAALVHVHRLRSEVDGVLVGVGTAIADNPQLNVRHVTGRNPTRVILDPSGRMPSDLKCLAADGARRIVVRACGSRDGGSPYPNGVETIELPAAAGVISPLEVVAALARTGLHRILIEGGAHTVSAFVNAGAVDRLHILMAPVILGSGKSGLALQPIERLSEALRFRADVHVLDGGDVLFDCDLRSRAVEGLTP